MASDDTGRRTQAEALGHDFTDWQNKPIQGCNFCHVDLNDPKVLEQCDISAQIRTSVQEGKVVRGKFSKD